MKLSTMIALCAIISITVAGVWWWALPWVSIEVGVALAVTAFIGLVTAAILLTYDDRQ